MASPDRRPRVQVRDLRSGKRKISTLKPYLRNPRTHSKKQIHQIAASIQEFGFNNPVLVDSENRIIAGHGRMDAAKLLGLQEVPTIVLGHLTEGQREGFLIADNKITLNAGWDLEVLDDRGCR
jgi:ParB-like chromosome segregation protein Spo0J